MKKIYSSFLIIAIAMFGFGSVANAATIAEFLASADGTNSTTLNNVTVTYQNDWYTWVQDATGSLLIHGDLGETVSNGDILSTVSGTYKLYYDTEEMVSPTGVTVTSGSAITAPATPLSDITLANINKFVSITGTVTENVSLEEGSSGYVYISDGSSTVAIYTKFKDIAMELSANDVVTVVGVISSYSSVPQVYPVSITIGSTDSDPDTDTDPSSTSTIAEFIASADDTNSTTLNDVTVVYQNVYNDKDYYTWVQDATGSLLVFGDLGVTVSNGDVISNLSGVYDVYYDTPEIKNLSGATITTGSAVTAPATSLSDITLANISKFVSITGTVTEDASLVEGSSGYLYISDGSSTVAIYTKFKDLAMEFSANEIVTVVGVISSYNSSPQLYPISITKNTGSTTAVDNTSIASSIYSNGGVVYVEAEAGAVIKMYTIDGRSISSSVANSNLTAIDASNAKIVIVTVDGKAAKVAVK